MGITVLILKGFFLSHRDIANDILYMSRAGYHFPLWEFMTMPNSMFKKFSNAAHEFFKAKRKAEKEARSKNQITLNNDDLEDD